MSASPRVAAAAAAVAAADATPAMDAAVVELRPAAAAAAAAAVDAEPVPMDTTAETTRTKIVAAAAAAAAAVPANDDAADAADAATDSDTDSSSSSSDARKGGGGVAPMTDDGTLSVSSSPLPSSTSPSPVRLAVAVAAPVPAPAAAAAAASAPSSPRAPPAPMFLMTKFGDFRFDFNQPGDGCATCNAENVACTMVKGKGGPTLCIRVLYGKRRAATSDDAPAAKKQKVRGTAKPKPPAQQSPAKTKREAKPKSVPRSAVAGYIVAAVKELDAVSELIAGFAPPVKCANADCFGVVSSAEFDGNGTLINSACTVCPGAVVTCKRCLAAHCRTKEHRTVAAAAAAVSTAAATEAKFLETKSKLCGKTFATRAAWEAHCVDREKAKQKRKLDKRAAEKAAVAAAAAKKKEQEERGVVDDDDDEVRTQDADDADADKTIA